MSICTKSSAKGFQGLGQPLKRNMQTVIQSLAFHKIDKDNGKAALAFRQERIFAV